MSKVAFFNNPKIVRRWVQALCCAPFLAAAQTAFALDGMSLEYGTSNSTNADVKLVRLSAQWNWNERWFDRGDWFVRGYWEASIAAWENNSLLKTNSGLIDIGYIPVLRFQQRVPSAIAPYIEGGSGLHWLFKTSVSTERDFGSHYQFGSHVGAGVRFGEKHKYDLSYRYQHISNAGFKQPNQGINFNLLRFGYNF